MPVMPSGHEPPEAETQTTETALASGTRDAVDTRGIALTVLALAAAILLVQYMQSVLIPFVLAGLVFYALDPLVDYLQRVRIPRGLGAALAIALVVGVTGTAAYSLS